MLHMKQLNSKKTRFPRFDKILVIQPIAEVYGERNERQLWSEIVSISVSKSSGISFVGYLRLFIVATGCSSERRPQKTVCCYGG